MAFEVPVLFIIFSRPDTTRLVFEEIRKRKPKHLLVFCDGPRPGRADDLEKTQASKAVIESVDWDCDLKLNYQTENFGCGMGPKMAIDWLFSMHDRGIILEDDCVASASFFTFCEAMLEQYADNPRIMHISGVNFLDGYGKTAPADYYFSKHQHCWGWATWKRAWDRFDYHMKDYPDFLKNRGFHYVSGRKQIREYWKTMMDEVYYPDSTDIWDYQWSYAIWNHKALCITPSVNLISNIGFGVGATHTKWEADVMNNMPRFELAFPVRHPKKIQVDAKADLQFNIFYKTYRPKSWGEMAQEFLHFFHPRKNPYSIRFYQNQLRPVLVKLGLKSKD